MSNNVPRVLFHETIQCLVAALEARDPYTRNHSKRVADLTLDLGCRAGLQVLDLELIHLAALVHDIGKIGVPDQILRKPGPLLPREWELFRQHPEIGQNILGRSLHLEKVAELVLHHHERWDGNGYPEGLKGERIPIGSRIIALADGVDAMTSARAYRPPLSWLQCKREIYIAPDFPGHEIRINLGRLGDGRGGRALVGDKEARGGSAAFAG
ncbi:MAG: HD domain-containing protein [Firmicutes bacterium]|nr:HD domain-containing protein [Bacillota bacterium]